ncbi:hypothetical protein AYL99_01040 [Fonsecaea erecta]|uniref:G-patch domain-containing protein n=1 Tax=Fonsecaea erecta TaxID=1367422 RepID=A0A178ZZ13_9EURO|nr:hypothetical protein AYL99_01040 [Fonsecaea erecta]OAP65068.1 hypothetical protein AYL99_01040 [Fonsecaea erecta]
MDAHAHLLSLGWAGPGHSLDSRPYKQKGHRGLAYDPAKVGNNGVGLVKPLSISQRKGRFGVGRKTHEPPAGNQWWLKGFENALGNIGKSESERSSGTATPIANDYGAGKHGGLYSFFVKGQEMEGTIGKVGDMKRTSKKRKSDALDDGELDDTAEATEIKGREATAEFEEVGAFFALRDKDEKRSKRVQKQHPVTEFEQVGQYLQATLEKKQRKRKSQIGLDTLVDVDTEMRSPPGHVETKETKEERRERRRRRKEKKEQKRNALADLENHKQTPLLNDADPEDPGAKAERRAERKRRKSEKSTKSSKQS